jgi:hypothetical protein
MVILAIALKSPNWGRRPEIGALSGPESLVREGPQVMDPGIYAASGLSSHSS